MLSLCFIGLLKVLSIDWGRRSTFGDDEDYGEMLDNRRGQSRVAKLVSGLACERERQHAREGQIWISTWQGYHYGC